jgi:glucosamine--fructose-6-phosphate aminotransferase (isomerizing)
MNQAHPMLQNILALGQPSAWQASLDLADEGATRWLASYRACDFQRLYFVGCGSSLYNGQVGKYAVERLAQIPCEAVPAYSFATYAEPPLLGPGTLVVGISTTGGARATCRALERARQAGAPTLAITAHAGSPITQAAQDVLLTGGEDDSISVKTKSYVQALVAIYALALRLAEATGAATPGLRDVWLEQIAAAAAGSAQVLAVLRPQIADLAAKYAAASKVFVFGAGPNLGTAEEASLKMVEMAKLYSEAGEIENFLHGRLREVDPANPIFLIAPAGRASGRALDFLTVTHTVGAPTIVLTDRVTPGVQRLATDVVEMPVSLDEYATPLLYILPLYLFGFELALARGYDPNARRYNIVPQDMKYQE